MRNVKRVGPIEAKKPLTLAARQINAKIESLDDWRGSVLARVRALILEADPEAVEEVKWRGVPVWSHDGIICTGETYKAVVKLTFANGAALNDPSGLFNASLEGKVRRAIDMRDGDKFNERAFKALICETIALNTSKVRAKRPGAPTAKSPKRKKSGAAK